MAIIHVLQDLVNMATIIDETKQQLREVQIWKDRVERNIAKLEALQKINLTELRRLSEEE